MVKLIPKIRIGNLKRKIARNLFVVIIMTVCCDLSMVYLTSNLTIIVLVIVFYKLYIAMQVFDEQEKERMQRIRNSVIEQDTLQSIPINYNVGGNTLTHSIIKFPQCTSPHPCSFNHDGVCSRISECPFKEGE